MQQDDLVDQREPQAGPFRFRRKERQEDLAEPVLRDAGAGVADPHLDFTPPPQRGPQTGRHRSEEHTSELQSLAYLVCRLLLEKKKRVASGGTSTTSALR